MSQQQQNPFAFQKQQTSAGGPNNQSKISYNESDVKYPFVSEGDADPNNRALGAPSSNRQQQDQSQRQGSQLSKPQISPSPAQRRNLNNLQSNLANQPEQPAPGKPSKAFEEAVRNGSQVIPNVEQEKQLYIQQQEIELLKEDNTLLKSENDRLIKMLYEKEQQNQEQIRGQIDVKDKKIRQAETEMNHQKKLVEDLRLELVSKQLDRDNLKSQLINQSFSPLLFLNDHSRSEFWKMITRYETDAINFQDDKETIQKEILDQRTVIARQEIEIAELKKQLDDYFAVKKEFMTLKVEYDKLYDRYNEIEHSYKEINLRFTSLEKQYHFIEKDRENSHGKVIELTNLLQERSVESNNEKRALREFLNRLEQEKGLAEESSKGREKDFSSYRVGKTSRPLNIADYFIRLKTTSVSSEKYADTLELMLDLYRNEKLESERLGTKLLQESLTMQVKNPENYKFIIKAFSGKNNRVLQIAFKFIKEIGELEDRATDYVNYEGSQALLKLYKLSDDPVIKQEVLSVLKVLCDEEEKIALEVVKYGVTQNLIDDLKKHTRGVSILSTYLAELLEFISKVCKHGQGINDFISPQCMNSLVLCLQSEKPENKVPALNCMIFLAKTAENRSLLQNYDIFNIIIGSMIKSVQAKDWKVAYAAIGALAFFAFERTYRVLLSNANQMFSFYETLLGCIQGLNANGGIEIPASTRYAAAVILAKMLADKDLFGIQEAIMKEGVLTHLSKGLKDKQASVRKECASIIIQLQKFVDTKIEVFRPLVNPLITNLGDDDETLAVRSMQCLSMLAANESLRGYIIQNGCVSILCSFLMQDPKNLDLEVLKNTVDMLISLLASQEAREITYESNVILPILGFLSSDVQEIRGLFYEAIKEFCAYQSFRTQLENAENSMLIVKRAIRTGEQAFILQLIAVVRVLVQSPILLEKLIDPVTIPKLFDIYMLALQWADPALEIYILQTLRLLFTNENGKIHVLKSEQILNYICKSMVRDADINVANEAAILMIDILKEPQETLLLLKKVPVVKSMMAYSKVSNNIAMTRSSELARLVRNIPFLYTEYSQQVGAKPLTPASKTAGI